MNFEVQTKSMSSSHYIRMAEDVIKSSCFRSTERSEVAVNLARAALPDRILLSHWHQDIDS